LKKNKEPIYGPDGLPLHEPPPAPLISNLVVRKAIHEVRRHIVEYLTRLGRKPDEIHVELAREAKMGKVDADRLLFKIRLRNRIRNEITQEFNLDALSASHRRVSVDRVILAVHQRCVCPLCGKTFDESEHNGITPRTAALGQGCELAHIIPKGSGGHNGFGNIVLAHTKCNRDMARRTPRQFWQTVLAGGFEEGISRIERIFGDIDRPKFSDVKNATGNPLWLCYFEKRDDLFKIEQFKKDVKDIQENDGTPIGFDQVRRSTGHDVPCRCTVRRPGIARTKHRLRSESGITPITAYLRKRRPLDQSIATRMGTLLRPAWRQIPRVDRRTRARAQRKKPWGPPASCR
jgi:5-methylcytosine-specific restriction endonuclease McrA